MRYRRVFAHLLAPAAPAQPIDFDPGAMLAMHDFRA
jgi:hypothetical protein